MGMVLDDIRGWVTLATGIVACLGGWGAIRYMLNLRAERHKVELENKKNELDIMRALYEQLDRKVKELSAKVDELYKQVHSLEREKIELIQKKSILELELQKSRSNVCLRPDDECFKRMPDRDYCRLVRLVKGKYDHYHETETKPDGNADGGKEDEDGEADESDEASDGH